MTSYCRGEQSSRKISVNEDLEAFFEDLQLGKHKSNDDILAYYLPRLTEEEMALVEAKDQNYFQNFSTGVFSGSKNPDMSENSRNNSALQVTLRALGLGSYVDFFLKDGASKIAIRSVFNETNFEHQAILFWVLKEYVLKWPLCWQTMHAFENRYD